MKSSNVRAWSETVIIPTYGIGSPNPNPMFLDKRVYQGSSGAVYPHPVIDKIDSEKKDQSWTAVYLENDFIKVMILPELGGRVQQAVDKTNGYNFVYHNRVIKPALVGLTGPWISGGIEFNWPQHHRPSTYDAVDWWIEESDDGSRTVWCSELERMFRTRGCHGFTVYPDRAGLDIQVRLHNRTDQTQTFLWWANPAVHVNDNYQSVFPQDVHAVMDHGKRDVSRFPIATGTYYKQDYAPGTDISRYRNIPVPTSYMAYHSDYDFVGCYDHGPRAGLLHVANHHLVPGKKQWTWGNGEFGKAWDRQLTDEDGPYIELMCGGFTDNQPDFTWLMPGEEKSFTQTFMPYKDIGPAHNASQNWAVHLEVENDNARIGIYAAKAGSICVQLWHNPAAPTSFHNHKNMQLRSIHRPPGDDAKLVLETYMELEATQTEFQEIPCPFRPSELTLRLLSEDRKNLLLEFSPPDPDSLPEIPDPANPAKDPKDLPSIEELYLNGLHLEQYRHATFSAEAYYREALRRDPNDSRCNVALGRRFLNRGEFKQAEGCFRRAIDRLTLRNPNPYDGEAYYQLGLCLRLQNRLEEAFDVFYKAAWSEAWKSPAFLELSRLARRSGHPEEALELVEESLARNTRHQKARHLRIALLRDLGRSEEATAALTAALDKDPLDRGLQVEANLLGVSLPDIHCPNQDFLDLETGLDYLAAGFTLEAGDLFQSAQRSEKLAFYFRAQASHQTGRLEEAKQLLAEAATQSPAFVFPNLIEAVPVLEGALTENPQDALAAYALGNFFYAKGRHEDAISAWEQCTRAQPLFPTAWRNLGLAYMNKRKDADAAGKALSKAFHVDPTDARVLYELDQFAKECGRPVSERLDRLDAALDTVLERDDLCVEYLRLLNLTGRAKEALKILSNRSFHPWEGGEGKTPACYQRALILMAEAAMQKENPAQAEALLIRAGEWPENLGEGKLSAATENERWLKLGRTLRAQGKTEEARTAFQKATCGDSEPAGALYYNDQPPENIYFQGLAWRELGDEEQAKSIFQALIDYAAKHESDNVQMDYFAVSLPDFLVFDVDLEQRNRHHCLFMSLLGHWGLDNQTIAEGIQAQLLQELPDHGWQLLKTV